MKQERRNEIEGKKPHHHNDDDPALCPICSHPSAVCRELKRMPQQELEGFIAHWRTEGMPEMANYYVKLLAHGDRLEAAVN